MRATIPWKKVLRSELSGEEAGAAARLLEHAGVDLIPMWRLLQAAVGMAVTLSHPAYDCLYLALAVQNRWTCVTADESFVRKVRQRTDLPLAAGILTLGETSAAV